MFDTDNDTTITLTPKSQESRWITVDEDNNIISEAKTPKEAIEEANKTDKAFTVMFVPMEGNTYIF